VPAMKGVLGVFKGYLCDSGMYGGHNVCGLKLKGVCVAAGCTGGIAHPPGYPLFTMLAIVMHALPLGIHTCMCVYICMYVCTCIYVVHTFIFFVYV
jgi:hypothetical protein